VANRKRAHSKRRTESRASTALQDPHHWPGEVSIYSYEEIPLDRDLFLVGDSQLEDLRREWKRYNGHTRADTPHPNIVLKPRFCAVHRRSEDSCELSFEINIRDRWHDGVRVLSRSAVVLCINWPNYGKRPYLVVEQKWLDELSESRFSIYALVDVIGVKRLVAKTGRIDRKPLDSLRLRIDQVASKNREYAFLSFADNVLIRRDWTADQAKYEGTYEPEKTLDIISEVFDAIHAAFGLPAYAVVSQGANWVTDEAGSTAPKEPNHIVFGSLGAPFVELFEIERAVRTQVSAGGHAQAQLYLAGPFAKSLRFKGHAMPHFLRGRMVRFDSVVIGSERSLYLPVDMTDIVAALQLPCDRHPAI
jgi:hypothetical protein